MAKQNLLLVDADPRSLRLLEVSLRKAGYSITTCASVDAALELVELVEPDAIIADTRLPGRDGFALVEALRDEHGANHPPLMFLSSDPSVESKVRGLELGIEDYLTKPVTIREILARVKYVLERSERAGIGRAAKTRFSGSLEDMGLVDLLQTIDMSRKSGVLRLSSGKRLGTVFFHEGRVMEAELGRLRGAHALYRFMLWSEGSFELEFRDVRAEDKIGVATQALLMEGMRRLDEWGRLQEQLPGLDCVLEIQPSELAMRLGEIPDELNTVLRAFDGQRDLAEVLDAVGGDDLTTLNSIGKLFFDGFLLVRPRTDPTVDTQVGTQSGAPSDPFLGFVPSDSLPPEPPVQIVGLPPPANVVTSIPVQLSDRVPEEAPRSLGHAVQEGSEVAPVGTGRTSLVVVQLKRVLAISDGNGQRPRAVSMEIGGERPESRSSTPAPEGDDDMMERGKRKAEQAEERESSNVIRLHGARGEQAGGGARASERADHDVAAHSVERLRSTSETDSGEHEAGEDSKEEAALPAAPGSDVVSKPSTGEPAPQEEAELHHDDDSEVRDFFAASPKSIAPSGEPWLDFDHDHEPQHAPAHKGAMYWTLGIMGAGLLLIGAFLLYHKVLMPTEEPFVGHAPIALPTPDMVKVEPTPEPPAAEEPSAAVAGETTPGEATPSAVTPSEVTPTEAAPTETAPTEAAPSASPSGAAPAAAAPAEAALVPAAPAEAAQPTQDGVGAARAPAHAPAGNEPTLAQQPSGAADAAALLEEARKAGFRRSADQLYLKALAADPSLDEALSGLALLYLNLGKNADAKQRAQQALALDETNDEAWIVLGAAESAVGREPAAREAYRRCASLPSGKHVAECKRLVR